MFSAFLSVMVTIAQLTVFIAVLIASYAAALYLLGLLVLAFRSAVDVVKKFVGKVFKAGRIRASLDRRAEFVKRYKEEKKNLEETRLSVV